MREANTETFAKLGSVPTITGAQLNPSANVLSVQFTQRDYVKCSKRQLYQSAFDLHGQISWSMPIEMQGEASTPSPVNGQYIAVISKTLSDAPVPFQSPMNAWSSDKSAPLKNCTLVEIWSSGYLIQSIALGQCEIYTDDYVGCAPVWSPDEKHIALVVERPKLKQRCAFQDDFGEKYTGRRLPTVCVIENVVTDPKVHIWEVNEDEALGGNILFTNETNILYQVWPVVPRAYGLVACLNRPVSFYTASLDGKDRNELSGLEAFPSVRSPRLSPTGKELIFLSNPLGGAHNSCARLVIYDLNSKTARIVVDSVWQPDNFESFPGLFTDHLPKQCFIDDCIITPTSWGLDRPLIKINLKTGQVKRLTLERGVWQVLDIKSGIIIALSGHSQKVHQLQSSFDSGHTWRCLNHPAIMAAQQAVQMHLDFNVKRLTNLPGVYNVHQVLLLQPKTGPCPLILYPHGGPHGAFVDEWMTTPVALVHLGFAVALVNFVGSTGYGEKMIQDLVGHIGSLDVQQTHSIGQALLQQQIDNVSFDSKNLFVLGGSHGGFIAAGLVAMFPDSYRACVLRNPVIDVASNPALSDIPDWSYAESGLLYDFSHPTLAPLDSQYTRMRQLSPISQAHAVKAASLLMLGHKDRRVPPYQGMAWHYALRSHGVDSRVLTFPDTGHALDSLEAEFIGYQALSQFLLDKWI